MGRLVVSAEERRLLELNRRPEGDWRGPDELLGPIYPDLGATVAKFRRRAEYHGSVKDMPKNERHAYADAIEKAIHARHRTLHMKPNPPTTPGWYNPPSVTRLLRHNMPPRGMVDEPEWKREHNASDWQTRAEAVYAAMMEAKRG
jgi:hypothetical protein